MSKEILLLVDSIANEKGVDKSHIFEAVESALATVAAKQYHDQEVSISVSIDRKTGHYEVYRCWTVTEDEQALSLAPDKYKYISLEDARAKNPDLNAGDVLKEKVQSFLLRRIAAQQAKQAIMRKVREVERKKIEDDYRARVGQLVRGTVKRATRDFIILELGGGAEAVVKREDTIPKEVIREKDCLRAYLYAINSSDKRDPPLLVSRTHPQMLVELFKIEVPEIGEQVIEIQAVARDPGGARAKIAVKTNDGRIDPVGACVGMRGARVQAVSRELAGERIDIVLWDENPAQLVINALSPAEVVSIVVDEDNKTMDVAVSKEQLSQAIGRGGQNVRLASELTGWRINVMGEAEAQEKRDKEIENSRQSFIKELNVDETLAQALVDAGFAGVEDLTLSNLDDMLRIPGYTQETLDALRTRTRDMLLIKKLEAQLDVQEPTDPANQDLHDLPGMTQQIAKALRDHGIVSQKDLAEQSVDELADMGVVSNQAAELIMAARAKCFTDNAN